MYKCTFCDYQSSRRYNLKVHVKNKHNSQTGSGVEQPHVGSDPVVAMEQTASSQPQIDMHSNQQEENVDQLYENIDQWKEAYDKLKEQFQQVEKVTTCDDGRPSHVSIQLFDKCCKGLIEYRDHCQGLLNLCQRVHTEKEQQLDRFCTAWEDLKWERDTFANEMNRRDCCGEGVIDERLARKLRKKCWGSEH